MPLITRDFSFQVTAFEHTDLIASGQAGKWQTGAELEGMAALRAFLDWFLIRLVQGRVIDSHLQHPQ
jgi:hypothetical protein